MLFRSSGVLGLEQPGKHPGHWMCLFPKPVTWIIKRAADAPFVEQDPKYGTVYRVGGRDDMVRLDLKYATRWSLWLDLKILIRTVRVVLSGTGAY